MTKMLYFGEDFWYKKAMPRQARLDVPGVLQHVIARGIERREIFSDEFDYHFFTHRLGKLLGDTLTHCLAWALLPNHFHILLRAGSTALSVFMRRLLTSYAVSYNRRHRRSGHLFQNRYKSILCDQEPYLLELVRYIHLNPIRSGVVHDFAGLMNYSWCGDGALMGLCEVPWQEADEVLGYFDRGVVKARAAYRSFMLDGLNQGRRPDLMREGIANNRKDEEDRKKDETGLCDPRILGNGDFVKEVFKNQKQAKPEKQLRISWEDLLRDVSERYSVFPEELLSGSKRAPIARGRSLLIYVAVRRMGMRVTEVANLLSVTQSAATRSLYRANQMFEEDKSLDDLLKNS